MHIHKPDDVLLLLNHAERTGRPTLTVTVAYVFGLDGVRLTEQAAWSWLLPLFPDEPFDLGEKKAGGGFGVAGEACAPQGSQVTGLTVQAGVGTLETSLLVLGDRYWTRGLSGWQASEPRPFERMPVGLARAYGAPEWSDNPYGRGWAPEGVELDGLALPNVELPAHPVLKPTDTPATATFGPHPMGSIARTRWLGKLDEAWALRRLPWLPDDTDPRWFDRFDPAQCQAAYWRGDEPWFVRNMHPRQPEVRGKLPGLRPRLLLRTVAEPDRHQELALDLDTVWLMPNDERAVVLYRAQTKVAREDARDIAGLAVFTESLTESPNPLAHWSQAWRDALEAEHATAPPVPVPLAPEALAKIQAAQEEAGSTAAEFESTLTQDIEQAFQSAEAEATAQVRAQGLDVAALRARAPKPPVEPPEPPLPSEPAAYAAALKARIDQAFVQAEQEARDALTAQGLDADALRAQAATQPKLPDTLAGLARIMPLPDDMPRQPLVDEVAAFEKEMEGLGAQLQAQYDAAQQEADAALAAEGRARGGTGLPEGPRVPLTREDLLNRVEAGESCAWTQMEDLDLSGVELSQVDLRQAVLTRCNLQGAQLDSANLTDAILTQCVLSAVRLESACLAGAQLDACHIQDSRLAGVDGSGARLHQCVLDGSELEASRWDDAQFVECSLAGARLKQACGLRTVFQHCAMPGIDASGSHFSKASFEQCALDGARFNAATLAGSTLQACQAAHAQFDGASMPGLRTLLDTQLNNANLHAADLEAASLQNTALAGAILREARLDGAFVKACDLSGTDAWRMEARKADFTDSRIAQASWRGANLMQASMRQATLLDTDLTGANLHACETRTATIQGLTLDQALMTRCRLLQEYGHG
ncbi:DUF2169 domain-containing protein [Pusillimonas sp. SM2304]|uniref:DUF2169 family type VI secretion system accessory protein n=1 Tax=Pusillimonas sp. SM2304 TaxID=3073241 RepID=UPI002874726D|nr:DUF2169 domain-containing protein [Pusillimonas sp. SM2304]MDS1139753.1 DUF2169 domain-containing protein [Pusillimonas sp. SM2304]